MEIITTKLTKKGYIIKINNKIVKHELNGKYFTKEEAVQFIKSRIIMKKDGEI